MSRLIRIGQVITTQGINGEVRVLPLTDFPERFNSLAEVLISRQGSLQKLVIEGVRQHKHFVIIKFSGYDSPEAAAALRGVFLQIPEEQVMPLPEGHYYFFQLVGMTVVTTSGRVLGKIAEILQTGSNDVYLVRDETDHREILIPALKSVVRQIDLETGVMQVDLPPGLEESTTKVVRQDVD